MARARRLDRIAESASPREVGVLQWKHCRVVLLVLAVIAIALLLGWSESFLFLEW
jgi:hypothetical protein